MSIIGIDLGATNSIAVVFRNGKVEMIPNEFGEYLTPSVVTIEDGELIVGKIAKEKLVTNPENTVSAFKRKMGTNSKLKLGKKNYLPEELSALVLKQLIKDAEKYLSEKIDEVVISVPAYFDAKQRRATKVAGEMIGVKVDRLINEPSAAAISQHNHDYETFIVFDFGGGTLDVSVVDCFDNVINVCSISGNNNLGGRDFDKLIAVDFCKENSIDYNSLIKSEKESLILASERAKIELQNKEEIEINLSIRKKLYKYKITNEKLKMMSIPILNEIKEVIKNVVKDSGFEANEIDEMIMVGGSSNMPIIKEYLEKLLKIPVILSEDSDCMVAKGLGKYLGIKERKNEVKDMVVTDICPFSLSTSVVNDADRSKPLSRVIIPKNTVLPSSKTIPLQNYRKGARKVGVSVYQGEEMYAEDNILLGYVEVPIPINFKENEVFNITYSYDINSMLYIEVEVLSTKKKNIFRIGEGKNMESILESKKLNKIKEISIKLNKNPEYDLCIERAKRIFKEIDPYYREILQEKVGYFQMMYEGCVNSMQKKREIIIQFEKLLEIFENISEFDENSIFSVDEKIDEIKENEKLDNIIDGTGGRLS